MILANNPDRAVTVRERDPTYPEEMMCPGDREALWLTKSMGIRSVIRSPLPHGHGSVNFRFSMIPSSLKFQVSDNFGL